MLHSSIKLKLQTTKFWLLTIAGLLIILNWHIVGYDSVSLIFWGAALYITWRERHNRTFDSNILSTSIGLLLIIWVLFRSCFSGDRDADVLTYIYPFISCLGIFFLTSKINKISHYWREFIIVGLTSIPYSHIFAWLSASDRMSIIDAKVSRLLLWYVGFDVEQVNNLVNLPTGSIKIGGSCSSFDLLWLIWQFCLVVYLCFSLKIKQKILLGFWATVIALLVNGIRLCLMAILVANERQEAFEYWHGSSGAAIFTNVAVFSFALAYWLLTRQKKQKPKDLSKLYEL